MLMKRYLLFFLLAIFLLTLFLHFFFGVNYKEATLNFIDKYFVLGNGAVLLESSDRDIVLSESAGLYLIACVKMNNRASFDKVYNFVKRELISDNGLLYWKINLRSGEKSKSSASLDDLRVIKALLLAQGTWKEKSYLVEALKISAAIKLNEVRGGYLVDSFDWQLEGSTSGVVNISYLDLSVMKELSKYDPDWELVYQNSRKLLLGAIKENGLFWEEYDLEKKKFSYSEGNMINQLLSALNLSEAGEPEAEIKLYGFLRSAIKEGKIFNAYDVNGRPGNKDECAAVYVLAARLFRNIHDETRGKFCLKKMLSFQIVNKGDKFYGGFGKFSVLEPKVFNSFDSLQALLTLIDH